MSATDIRIVGCTFNFALDYEIHCNTMHKVLRLCYKMRYDILYQAWLRSLLTIVYIKREIKLV